MAGTKASYKGTCPRCGEPYFPGDLIDRVDRTDSKDWSHAACVEMALRGGGRGGAQHQPQAHQPAATHATHATHGQPGTAPTSREIAASLRSLRLAATSISQGMVAFSIALDGLVKLIDDDLSNRGDHAA